MDCVRFTNHGISVLRYFLTRHVFLHSYPDSYHIKPGRISTLAWTANNGFVSGSLQFPCIFLLSPDFSSRYFLPCETFKILISTHAGVSDNKYTTTFLGIDTCLHMSCPNNFLEIELSPSVLPHSYSLDFAFLCNPFQMKHLGFTLLFQDRLHRLAKTIVKIFW